MSSAWQYYIITLLVFAGSNLIAGWSLNLQFGLGGILNFGFIAFQAAGAYIASVLSLGSSASTGGFQSYILGAHLPWPLPMLAGAAAGALLAFVVGLVALRPRRIDYQGMALLTVGVILTVVISDYPGIFNGISGLVDIPKPLGSTVNLGVISYGWFFVGVSAVVTFAAFLLVWRLTHSPWGRQLRALRENPNALQALGVNIDSRRLQAFVVGGFFAGLSGALLVEFVGAWAPGSWTTDETFFFLVAVVIGGSGSIAGSTLGTVLVWTVILNGVEYLPVFSYTTVAVALQIVVVGLAFIVFIALKPNGLIPERPQRFGARRAGAETQPAPVPVPGSIGSVTQ
jgi:branched-chain amino acid transport system permease protein